MITLIHDLNEHSNNNTKEFSTKLCLLSLESRLVDFMGMLKYGDFGTVLLQNWI